MFLYKNVIKSLVPFKVLLLCMLVHLKGSNRTKMELNQFYCLSVKCQIWVQ